ncbi:acyl-CoA-binding protein [Thiomonas sp. FB-Cd]|uniref:acyl-CoA-binding protein n=1 Tax=Thiomonas sp. FB-Cd TaxID=1158292 RepID=UPI0004DF1028|nr:acyl-CoA-binding protein [Thiomonas sp. FB-Cd]
MPTDNDVAKDAFHAAFASTRHLTRRPDNAALLRLYALYKQASEGDAEGPRPGAMDFVARAKWDAWAALAGMTSEQAMHEYITLVETLKASQARD